MTSGELGPLMAEYRAGLEAEIALLQQLDILAVRERAVTGSGGLTDLPAIVEERERLMAAIVDVEHGLAPVRQHLASARDALASHHEFLALSALHRRGAALTAAILTSDAHSCDALRDAERVRTAAAHTLEQVENTLAAYRRVVAPGAAVPALVDTRG